MAFSTPSGHKTALRTLLDRRCICRMKRQPPAPIVHVRAEFEATVQAVLGKHGLAPQISPPNDRGIIELRFGQISDSSLLSWMTDLPTEALAFRFVFDDDPLGGGPDR